VLAVGAGLVASPWLRQWFAGPSPATAPSSTATAPVAPLATAPPAPTPAALAPPATAGATAPASGAPTAPVSLEGSPGPAPAAAALPPLLDDVSTLYGLAGTRTVAARRALAARWGAAEGVDPCTTGPGDGLACYRGKGGLAPIRQLDRPALLRLADAEGRSADLLLTGLDPQYATVQAGDKTWRVPLARLAQDWRGEFDTLWRLPPGWSGTDTLVAEAGPRAEWLAARLDQADPASQGRPLRDRVFAFQLAQGLVPDGLAGPQTLMRLSRAAGVDEPRLAAAPSLPRP